jgi:hypothetical protein
MIKITDWNSPDRGQERIHRLSKVLRRVLGQRRVLSQPNASAEFVEDVTSDNYSGPGE